MEDGKYLTIEDRAALESYLKELETLKKEHRNFAKNKGALTPEQRELWRVNSHRTNQVHIAVKTLRHKNILEAGK
jgi:hypothetical protein